MRNFSRFLASRDVFKQKSLYNIRQAKALLEPTGRKAIARPAVKKESSVFPRDMSDSLPPYVSQDPMTPGLVAMERKMAAYLRRKDGIAAGVEGKAPKTGEVDRDNFASKGHMDNGLKVPEGESKAGSGIKSSSTIEKSADEVNNWWKVEKGYDKPPYKPGTVIQEIELKETATFVRVYDDVNSFQKGGWVMKKEDIAGLTPVQIRDKFALPGEPKYITDVTIPSGTKIRVGEANSVHGWGEGGGIQIDIMGKRGIGEMFSNPRPLK